MSCASEIEEEAETVNQCCQPVSIDEFTCLNGAVVLKNTSDPFVPLDESPGVYNSHSVKTGILEKISKYECLF